MTKKKILFIHQNFPAQFKHLAKFMSEDKKYDVHSLSVENLKPSLDNTKILKKMDKIKHHKYRIEQSSSKNIHSLAMEFETKMIRAEAVAKECFKLKDIGFIPDLIISHPGWGELYFIKDIWPDAKLLSYFEFYYNSKGADVGFDTNEPYTPEIDNELFFRLRARNAPGMMSYLDSDLLISPTNYQKSTAPKILHNKIKVIHDGIETDVIKPQEKSFLKFTHMGKEVKLTKKDKIITFVSRNLELYRGYHIFMRSLPIIQKNHPDAFILIIGGDSVSYGASANNGKSYKDIYYDEVKGDLTNHENIIFLGNLDYNLFLTALDISDAHIYLTYPFVLSWSMLEAMSLEKLVIGSKTKPVEELIKNNHNGLLFDFFDYKKLAELTSDVLQNSEKYNKIRKNARKTIIESYDLKTKILPRQLDLVEEMLR
ncbi:glycosyltransferase [Hyphomicrobiales bacterium]|jgi:glycosyltransferase involved in cell wall biosynthesis|nr:glycosyltransferase [Hyphomicrobiales bacterium]